MMVGSSVVFLALYGLNAASFDNSDSDDDYLMSCGLIDCTSLLYFTTQSMELCNVYTE